MSERKQYILFGERFVETFTAIPIVANKGDGTVEVELTEVEDWRRTPRSENVTVTP